MPVVCGVLVKGEQFPVYDLFLVAMVLVGALGILHSLDIQLKPLERPRQRGGTGFATLSRGAALESWKASSYIYTYIFFWGGGFSAATRWIFLFL